MKNIKILFIVIKSKSNTRGLSSLRCRVTYQGRRKVFSTGLFIKSNEWLNKQQKAKPSCEENDFINYQITLITNKLNKAFLFLQSQEEEEEEFTIDDIYAQYTGKPKANFRIIEYYSDFLDKIKKLIGIDIKQVTWNKYNYVFVDLKGFVHKNYNKKDVFLKDLDMSFLTDFEFYLNREMAKADYCEQSHSKTQKSC